MISNSCFGCGVSLLLSDVLLLVDDEVVIEEVARVDSEDGNAGGSAR
jgi:hypothetical protein